MLLDYEVIIDSNKKVPSQISPDGASYAHQTTAYMQTIWI
jgi:hypothetical protein